MQENEVQNRAHVNKLIVKGAREHNLKNIDVELPRDKLIVVSGLSGMWNPFRRMRGSS